MAHAVWQTLTSLTPKKQLPLTALDLASLIAVIVIASGNVTVHTSYSDVR
eukprot:gene12459-8914_t